MKLERRIVVSDLEVRAGGDNAGKKLRGHAAVFNRQVDLGWFIETVKPGAFTKTIAEDDVRALFNHDSNMVLGRNRANTLSMYEDSIGLMCEIDPPDTVMAQDLMKSIARGDISQMSFGFYARGVTIRRDGDNYYRDLIDVQLYDVSPVTFPAYEDTDVAVRSNLAGLWMPTAAEIEQAFRQSGPEKPDLVEEWKHDLDRRRRLIEVEARN